MESLLSLSRISRRRRNILLACCAFGAGGYVSYRVYTSSSVTHKRRQLYRFFHLLSSLVESAAQGSQCAGLLCKDLHSFLLSDQDEVPQSLKQLLKVGQTQEFRTSSAFLFRSLTEGVVSGLSGKGPILQGGNDHGLALYEDLSFPKEGLRKIGKAGRELGSRESRDRRWRSSGEIDALQFKDTVEDEHNYRRGKLGRSESASRIDGEEGDRWFREEDEAGRYPIWRTQRSYYREKGPWATASVAETGGDGGKGKNRSHGDRRGRVEGRAEGLPERLVGKLFSEAGRGFASAVVASAARSLVLSVLEGMQRMQSRELDSAGEELWSSVDWEGVGGKDPQQKRTREVGTGEETLKKSKSFPPSGTFQSGMIDFLCSSQGKSLIADCTERFIGTAVSIYLDKTRDVNVYEDILSTVSKPAHLEPVKELLTSVCNGVMETLIRTSRDVMFVGSSPEPRGREREPTTSRVGSPGDAERSTFSLGKSSCFDDSDRSEFGDVGKCGRNDGASTSGSPAHRTPEDHDVESLSVSCLESMRIAFDRSPQINKKVRPDDLDKVETIVLPPSSSGQINGEPIMFPSKSTEVSHGWIDGVSRTLAVPSNRALVLDVAGTVTAEAVRSTFQALISTVSLTLRRKAKEREPVPEGRPRTSKVFHVINKTGELAQATAGKAMVAMTMCLAICLHTLVGPSRVLEIS